MQSLLSSNPQTTTSVDSFGRLLIPQEIRKALHWGPGVKVGLSLDEPNRVILTTVEEEPVLKAKNGWIVVGSQEEKTLSNKDVTEALSKSREQRTGKFYPS